MTSLVTPEVLRRFHLDPKDERYTLDATKTWALETMRLRRFTLDVAGCPEAHLAKRWFGLQPDGSFVDGLEQPWVGAVWCNPPFTQWGWWLAKAWAEWSRGDVMAIALLLPNDKTEQPTWHDLVAGRRDRRGSPLRTFEHPDRPRFAGPGTRGKPVLGADGRVGSPFFGCYLLGWHRRFLRGSP